jgi:amino acid transporter
LVSSSASEGGNNSGEYGCHPHHPPHDAQHHLDGNPHQHDHPPSARRGTYTLLDLISIGVGGTVGSGIFVLTGFIARHYAGPATFLSFAGSGFAALCSGLCYAEWAGRLPVEGSTYVYAFVSMGEFAAVLAGACLTLEYGVSGAAVARSWGDKVTEWTQTSFGGGSGSNNSDADNDRGDSDDAVESFFNPLAGLISLLSVVVLACGVQESKRVTNFFTILKVALVLFMIAGGFALYDGSHMAPLVPPALGATGVIRGATSSFFGYLGFDEVCCLASEAKHPSDMPKAVLWTLAIVTVIYILASIALTGMLDYTEISDTSGFPAAFSARGVAWAAQLTAAGEVVTLPVVVLISLLAQPRLFAAMAKDGLLPAIFARHDARGNLFWSSILCGIPMTLLATFVPFSWMDDAISVGILFAFNMTNTALILMKCNPADCGDRRNDDDGVDNDDDDREDGHQDDVDDGNDGILSADHPRHQRCFTHSRRTSCGGMMDKTNLWTHLVCYHVTALLAGLTSHVTGSSGSNNDDGNGNKLSKFAWMMQIGAIATTLLYACYLQRLFPVTGAFGKRSGGCGAPNQQHDDGSIGRSGGTFETPCVPFLPLLGVCLNWYLIAQLEWSGMGLLLLFLAIISGLYLSCISGRRQRRVPSHLHGNASQNGPYDELPSRSQQPHDGPILLREISMPKR